MLYSMFVLNKVNDQAFLVRKIMLHNIKSLYLHCVFHGIRFKVNEDWVSGIDTLLFLYMI